MAYLKGVTLWLLLLFAALAAAEVAGEVAQEDAPEAPEACEGGSEEAKGRVSTIRHASSVIAGFADGALAQVPGGTTVVPVIQAAMIFAIAQQYGCYMDFGMAVAVATMLGSDYVKMSLVRNVVGWVPLAGNVVKTGLSVVMTEGIGLAAEKMLSCPVSRLELLNKAASEDLSAVPWDQRKEGSVVREHFHAMSEFLCNASWSSTTDAARELWNRVESLFRAEDQVALLRKVDEARSPQELLSLVQQYSWNLKMVEESLGALRDRFPRQLACTDADILVRRLWSSKADGEVKAVVAPYVLHCRSWLSPELREETARTATKLTVEAMRLGGGPRAVLPGALGVLMATLRDGPLPDAPSEALLDALMRAVQKEALSCSVLRELFQSQADAVEPWIQVKHLKQLEDADAAGAELCLPSLMALAKHLLTKPQLPGLEVSKSSGSFGSLVGQRCAVRRLMQTPGYVRLRKKGIQRPGVPLVLLMTGPSGTGKTLAARKLAEYIHGQPIQELQASGRFKLFPMNQFRMAEDLKTFFGPPRGIQGSGDLPDLVRPNPDAVIVLDEIEKAHHSFAKALLTVFGEYGTVYDPRTGRDYPASNITFVLTSNLAKNLIIKHPVAVAKIEGRSLGKQLLPKGADADPDCEAYAELREAVESEISNTRPQDGPESGFFRESEIRGRLTDVLPFLPFAPFEVEEAVQGFLQAEAEAFAASPQFAHLELTWGQDVVSSFAGLYLRRPDEGLRAVNKQLQSELRDLLEKALDLGLVPFEGRVRLRVVRGMLDLRVAQVGHDAPGEVRREEPKLLEEEAQDTVLSSLLGTIMGDWKPVEPPTEESGWEWQHEWEWQSDWEWLVNWEWQQLWERIFKFLHQWRFPLVVTGLCLMALAVTSPVPLAPALAPASSAGALSLAASMVSWAMAVVQVAGGSASVAVPALTFFYAWKNRHYVEAVIFGAISLALCPWAVRTYKTTYRLLHPMQGRRVRKPKAKAPVVRKGLTPTSDSEEEMHGIEARGWQPLAADSLETPCEPKEPAVELPEMIGLEFSEAAGAREASPAEAITQ